MLDLFLEDGDLLEAVQLEGLFFKNNNTKPKRIEPQIEPDKAVDKTIKLLKAKMATKKLCKKYKSAIIISTSIEGKHFYDKFISGSKYDNHLVLVDFIEVDELIDEKYKDYDEASEEKQKFITEIWEIIDEINKIILNDGYHLEIIEDNIALVKSNQLMFGGGYLE